MAIEYLYFIYIVIYNQIYTKNRRGLLTSRFSIFINLLKKKKEKKRYKDLSGLFNLIFKIISTFNQLLLYFVLSHCTHCREFVLNK